MFYDKNKLLLFDACSSGSLSEVRYYLSREKERHTRGPSLLHMACSNKFNGLKIVKFLIENGANVNCVDNNKYTPLHCACDNDKIEILKYLLENGANINAKDKNDESPLDWLCYRNNDSNDVMKVKFIIENVGNICASPTSIFYIENNIENVICKYDSIDSIKLVIEHDLHKTSYSSVKKIRLV